MKTKTELETIEKIIAGLNYYQILKISLVASEADIRDAFHREAKDFHPDQYYSADPDANSLAKKIYAKIVDAYRTLSNKKKREDYDKSVMKDGFGSGKTSAPKSDDSIDENAITSARRKPAPGGVTSAGSRMFKMAQSAFASGNYPSARMNLQIALNTDPENPEFLSLMQRVEAALGKKK